MFIPGYCFNVALMHCPHFLPKFLVSFGLLRSFQTAYALPTTISPKQSLRHRIPLASTDRAMDIDPFLRCFIDPVHDNFPTVNLLNVFQELSVTLSVSLVPAWVATPTPEQLVSYRHPLMTA